MAELTDTGGRRWLAEKVGRTSGIMSSRDRGSMLEPSDIIRFSCLSDTAVAARETTLKVGIFDALSETELRSVLEQAREV